MPPTVSKTNLYSYLVTRHTGRAVRTSIEKQLAGYESDVLSVLDFGNVPLIDFSCADEVVVKLVRLQDDEGITGRFFLFRGVADHHIDPIQSALRRQALAVAAQGPDGEPLLLGDIDPFPALVWRTVWSAGRITLRGVAASLAIDQEAAVAALEELVARQLVFRDGEHFVSFRRALEEADGLPS